MPTKPSRPAAASPAKSLDEKLARIIADPSCSDFILADAKDLGNDTVNGVYVDSGVVYAAT